MHVGLAVQTLITDKMIFFFFFFKVAMHLAATSPAFPLVLLREATQDASPARTKSLFDRAGRTPTDINKPLLLVKRDQRSSPSPNRVFGTVAPDDCLQWEGNKVSRKGGPLFPRRAGSCFCFFSLKKREREREKIREKGSWFKEGWRASLVKVQSTITARRLEGRGKKKSGKEFRV